MLFLQISPLNFKIFTLLSPQNQPEYTLPPFTMVESKPPPPQLYSIILIGKGINFIFMLLYVFTSESELIAVKKNTFQAHENFQNMVFWFILNVNSIQASAGQPSQF